MIGWFQTKRRAEPTKEIEHIKMCMIFLPFTRDDALIVPYNQDGEGGIYYEMGEDFDRCAVSDPIRLGEITKDRFRRSERKSLPSATDRVPNYRLKVSKLKSDRQFEREYACYQVLGANSANITMVFKSPRILLKPLYVGASCNSFDEVMIGNTLLELHDFYRQSVHRPRENSR